ncbi:MAG TPA: DUF2752 domain-containing protein [Chitinophagaceae bacterium]
MKYREQLIWLSALVVLFFLEEGGPSLCLFKFAGLSSCPGCGLGHAIHYALHGAFRQSLEAHLLGVPATAFLLYSVIRPFIPPHKIHVHKNERATAYDATESSTG